MAKNTPKKQKAVVKLPRPQAERKPKSTKARTARSIVQGRPKTSTLDGWWGEGRYGDNIWGWYSYYELSAGTDEDYGVNDFCWDETCNGGSFFSSVDLHLNVEYQNDVIFDINDVVAAYPAGIVDIEKVVLRVEVKVNALVRLVNASAQFIDSTGAATFVALVTPVAVDTRNQSNPNATDTADLTPPPLTGGKTYQKVYVYCGLEMAHNGPPVFPGPDDMVAQVIAYRRGRN